jgi:hypothetical protein
MFDGPFGSASVGDPDPGAPLLVHRGTNLHFDQSKVAHVGRYAGRTTTSDSAIGFELGTRAADSFILGRVPALRWTRFQHSGSPIALWRGLVLRRELHSKLYRRLATHLNPILETVKKRATA